MGIGYVKLPISFGTAFSALSEAQIGRLIMAMLHMAETGEEPDFAPNQPEYYLWPQCRENLIDSFEAYEKTCVKNRQNGAKGGRPKRSRLGSPVLVEKNPALNEVL